MNYEDEVEYHNEIFKELRDSYKNNRLIPFIGAGFSSNVKNYPNWEGFIEKLSGKLGENKNYLKEKVGGESNYLVMAADYYSIRKFRERGYSSDFNKTECKKMLKGSIKEIISKDIPNKNSPIHKYLLNKFPYIFTTNWDDLLEKNDKDSTFEVISNVIKIKEIPKHEKKKRNLIIKMHGSYDDEDDDEKSSLVATEIDYLERLNNKNHPLNIKYQNEISHKDFLFLGFSFSDANINNLSYPIHIIKKSVFALGKAPKMFMLSLSEYDPILAEFYHECKGISVFFFDVAESDRKRATQLFLKYIVNDKTNPLGGNSFKDNLIEELKNNKKRFQKKLKFLEKNTKRSLILKKEFKDEIDCLKFKLEGLTYKIKKMKGG